MAVEQLKQAPHSRSYSAAIGGVEAARATMEWYSSLPLISGPVTRDAFERPGRCGMLPFLMTIRRATGDMWRVSFERIHFSPLFIYVHYKSYS
jgi:hypothetical protein